MRTYVRMIACVHLPRFELTAAAERVERGPACAGRRAAGGGAGRWGRRARPRRGRAGGGVGGRGSPRGERGMLLGEALARCPELVLVPGDPVRVAETLGGRAGGAGVDRCGRRAGRGRGWPTSRWTGCAGSTARRSRRSRPPGGRWGGRCGSGPRRRASAPWRRRWRRARAGHWCSRAPRRGAGWRGGRWGCSASASRRRCCSSRWAGWACTRWASCVKLGRPALADRFGAAGALAHGLACGRGQAAASASPAGAPGGVDGGRRRQQRRRAVARPGGAGRPAAGARPSGGGGRCARSGSRPSCSRAAAGTSRSSSARPSRMPSGSGWRCRCGWRCCPRRPGSWAWRSSASGRPAGEQGALLDQGRALRGGAPARGRRAGAGGRRSRRGAAAPSAWTPTRGCPSGAWCWPRSPNEPPGPSNAPRPARVRWGEGLPAEVDGEPVEAMRESWLVEDRWWSAEPLRRRYWELIGVRGRNLVVFHDLCTGRWFRAEHLDGSRWRRRPYVELHCHSAYSFLDGVSLPEELARRAGELGHEALALTDHNSVSGSMELAQSAADCGVQGDPRRRARRGGRGGLWQRIRGGRRAPRRRGTSRCSSATSAAGATSAGSSPWPTPTRARARPGASAGSPRSSWEPSLEHAEGLVCLTGCAERSVIGGEEGARTIGRLLRGVRRRGSLRRAAAPLPAPRPGPQPGLRGAGAAHWG